MDKEWNVAGSGGDFKIAQVGLVGMAGGAADEAEAGGCASEGSIDEAQVGEGVGDFAGGASISVEQFGDDDALQGSFFLLRLA